MADPVTSNILLAIPSRGSDSGVWDTPINGDFSALDGILGGNATIALSSATTLALSVPATGTVSASAGPNQSQNAVIKFTGTLTGNAVVQLTLPRIYTFDNQCTVGASYIQIAPASGTGTKVGLPPGEKTQVAFDGANVDYVGMGRVGSYLDLCASTTPAWMTACTTRPYLVADGATYSTSVYPALGNMLGSTFGGNGITTFGTPDLRNRYRIPLDTNQGGFSSRITAGVSGINGQVLGAAGGDQALAAHSHPITDKSHLHVGTNLTGPNSPSSLVSGVGNNLTQTNGSEATAFTGITATEAAGTGVSGNIPPGLIAGLSLIKT